MREDWIECSLGDLFVLIKNGSNIKQTENIAGIPVSRIETIWNEGIDWNRVKYALDFDENKHSQYLLIENDILFSHINSDSHLGKTAIFREKNKKLIHGINLLLMRPHSDLVGLFLLYFLRFHKYSGGFLDIAQRSVNQSSINQTSLKKVALSIPSKPEQRAIVKKLESLFSSLDAGVADLKKAQQQLKIYRQAVLKKAFEGEFEEVKFKELGDAIDPQPSHRTPPVDTNGIPFVSIKDIVGNKLELSKARLVSKNVLKEHLNRYTILENDFIIGKIGTIGNPVKVHLPQNYTLSANVVLIQPRKINSNYLYYYFKSSNIEQQFNSGKKATTQAAFGIQKVRELIIRYPLDDNQQRKIVLDIETKLSVCDSIEQNIKESLIKAEALRQSILKKAFEGNLLTAQELAACKQAADYEPASVLLQRIRNEKLKIRKK